MSKILTFGVYDYFHLGHLRLFKQCRKRADYLIVAVQDEAFIKKFKPNAQVMYSTAERVEMIEALRIVDKVVVYEAVCPEFLEKIDFDILALGEDQKKVGSEDSRWEIAIRWCEDHGKSVVRLKRTEGICSSDIKHSLSK